MVGNINIKILEMLEESKKIYVSLPKRAYDISEKAYKLSTKNNLKSEEANSLIIMAQASSIMSDVGAMNKLAYSAYDIFLDLKDKVGMSKALNLVGISYFYKSMYDQAANTLIKAIKLIEIEDDYKVYCALLNNIGEVFKESDNFDLALEYYDKGIIACDDRKLDTYKATMLDNIGDIYFIREEYTKAFEYFSESYEILKTEDDAIHLSESENRLGKLYYQRRDYKKSNDYFESALKRLEKVDNKFYSIDVLINIAKINFDKDQRKSFNSLEKAINYAETTNSLKKQSEAYNLAAELYEKTNNFKVALEYFKKHHFVEKEVKTSIMSDKLELIKMELDRIGEDNTVEDVIILNKQLESEISYQKHELGKIQNLNIHLEKKVFEDSLLEIPNRNYLDCNLIEYMKSCVSENMSMVLFMIDIDHFKKYNDYWGHLKGDECLKGVANSFKRTKKNRRDILGRYGGEEFIYCSKVTSYSEALELGEKLRSEIELLKYNYNFEEEENYLTISVGGAFVKPTNEVDIFSVIEIADKELYKGKDRARNIVMIKEM